MNRGNIQVTIWLGIMCFVVIGMIFIGGLTRLTDSGLSMTNWHPVTGVIPPMNDADWQKEFGNYQQSPEYIKHNFGMSIEEFKSIYRLEFIHRIAGRITGLLYFLPLIFFLFKGYIRGRDIMIYFAILLLLSGQGFMGWYMVKSGLVDNPYVSHYRLAAHLMLAVFIYIALFWQLMKNSFDIMLIAGKTNLCLTGLLLKTSIILAFLQIFFGALVAGLDAGLVYNSFPYMGDGFIPDEIMSASLSLNSLNDPVFVQLIHRMTAYLLFIIIAIFAIRGFKLGVPQFSKVTLYIAITLLLQLFAGIFTLLYMVPIWLALIHQLGAIILLSFLLWALFLIKSA